MIKMCFLKIWNEIREVHRLAREEFEADSEALYRAAIIAREKEEGDKLNRLELAELEHDEIQGKYKVVMMYDDDSLALLKVTEADLLSFLARKESTRGKVIFLEELI